MWPWQAARSPLPLPGAPVHFLGLLEAAPTVLADLRGCGPWVCYSWGWGVIWGWGACGSWGIRGGSSPLTQPSVWQAPVGGNPHGRSGHFPVLPGAALRAGTAG